MWIIEQLNEQIMSSNARPFGANEIHSSSIKQYLQVSTGEMMKQTQLLLQGKQ